MVSVTDGRRAPARHDHAVSFHDSDQDAVDVVAPYVADGFARDEPVVVVATTPHLAAVDAALVDLGLDPAAERSRGHYVTRDAAETLATFMVDGTPDPHLFRSTVGALVDEARGTAPSVRIFGEMVAVLWDEGSVPAAVALEECWNDLACDLPFTLLCAYPHDILDQATLADVGRVCLLHSDVLPPTSYHTRELAGHDPALGQASWAFLPVPKAIPALRHFVGETLRAWGEHRFAHDAVLVTSEIATNAISHADSPFHASITRSGGVVRIAIEDAGPGTATPRPAADDEVSGRGFAIVEALADRWGHGVLPGGKVVWAEFVG